MRHRGTRCGSGCWRCRAQKVKCSAETPVCKNCVRLGLRCGCEVQLTWIQEKAGDAPDSTNLNEILDIKTEICASSLEDWMFLNVTDKDIILSREDRPATRRSYNNFQQDYRDNAEMSTLTLWVAEPQPTGQERQHAPKSPVSFSPKAIVPTSPCWSSLSQSERYLIDYFLHKVGPKCYLDANSNPYVNLVLPMALSAPSGPLLQAVLGAAANQLRLLGSHGFTELAWLYRSRATERLRQVIQGRDSNSGDDSGSEQILGTMLMLCFSDVSDDCSPAWKHHSKAARAYLHSPAVPITGKHQVKQLCDFVNQYFTVHEVLSQTACISSSDATYEATFYSKNTTINGLTGCSEELISLISRTSKLADGAHEGAGFHEDMERFLHNIRQDLPTSNAEHTTESYQSSHDLRTIAEVKRLSALMYYSTRLKQAIPESPHIIRLTEKILSLLPLVPLRENALLWTLFIVGTMGVRSYCDEDRKVILERLAALQQNRQLGNVRKVRETLERVWKQRDLRQSSFSNATWADVLTIMTLY